MKKIKQCMLLLTISALIAFTNSANADRVVEGIAFLKNNDLQVINAAIKHPNGKPHFFVGKYFHVYNTSTRKLERMAKIGKEGWYGLPANVDAAFMHPTNKKAYIFKGNQYYRYDFTKKKVDKIGIVGQDGFKGLYGPFDAAITHPTNNKVYFFKGNKYYSYNLSTKKVAAKYIGKNAWKGVPISIDAIVMHKNGRAYAFKDDHYYRYVFGRQVDKKAVIGKDGWHLFQKLDAIVYNFFDKNISTNWHHFIRGKNVIYVQREEVDLINAWTGLDTYFIKKRFGYDWYKGALPNIDAGFWHPKNKKYYFLKQELYYRYNPKTKVIDKSGIIGKDAWLGVPINIDAAFMIGDVIFFFRGTKVFEYDTLKKKRVYYGEISRRFRGVPNFIDAAGPGLFGFAEISFVKNNMIYLYSFKDKKVISNGRMSPNLFK